jgi:hypothetical protein
MEELQDAIEDAQYMHAMQGDEGPQPTAEWVWPTAEELRDYTIRLLAKDPGITEIENFCKQSLGFHQVFLSIFANAVVQFHCTI